MKMQQQMHDKNMRERKGEEGKKNGHRGGLDLIN
jgi:hypothetical protein